MRWIETAPVPFLPLATCSSKTRPRVACRRTAALSSLLSPRARYGDSFHIHSFHPPQGEKRKELLLALMALRRTFIGAQLKTI